jgi:flavin-binding protein dodecin
MTVASVTEISAASPEGFEEAIGEGIERANETLATSKAPGSRT